MWHCWRRLRCVYVCVCVLVRWRGGCVCKPRLRGSTIKQVPASRGRFFWCLRFRQGVARCSRKLWGEEGNQKKHTHTRKKRDLTCVNRLTCYRREMALKARWEFHEYEGKSADYGPERSARLTWATLAYSGVSQQHLLIVLIPQFFLFFLPVCGQPLMASFGRCLVFLMSLWVVVNEAMWIRSIHMSEWVHKEVGTMSLSTWQWPELIWIKPQTCIAWEKECCFVFEIICKTSNI